MHALQSRAICMYSKLLYLTVRMHGQSGADELRTAGSLQSAQSCTEMLNVPSGIKVVAGRSITACVPSLLWRWRVDLDANYMHVLCSHSAVQRLPRRAGSDFCDEAFCLRPHPQKNLPFPRTMHMLR